MEPSMKLSNDIGFSNKNTDNDAATESKYSPTIINTFTNIRKWLFVPATNIELLAKAFDRGTDSVIVDIEVRRVA